MIMASKHNSLQRQLKLANYIFDQFAKYNTHHIYPLYGI